MIKKLSDRYDELYQELSKIESTKKNEHTDLGTFTKVDEDILLEWTVKVKNLITKTCGEESEHKKALEKAEETQSFESSYDRFKRLRSVFIAAKEDFQGGYLSSIKNLVQAELFDSELDQARELFSSGYKGSAAVIAGVVLETSLKYLCDQHFIGHSNLDKMNADLAKTGVYNKHQQKKITALADIRNRAAHGDWNSFSDTDVNEMIRDVESFLAAYLS